MLKTLTTLLLAAFTIFLIGAGVVYSGLIDVAADRPHSPSVHMLLETVRERSIATRASGIETPDLGDPQLIRSGAGNYDAMCVGCHLAPGMDGTELSQNLYPSPPNLTNPNRTHDPASDFWVIKHGIRSSGMPAWGKSMSDPYIWGLVALLEQLPSLTALEYQTLIATSEGHQHGGGKSMPHPADHPHAGEDAGHGGQQPSDVHQLAEPQNSPHVHQHADGSEHSHGAVHE